MPAANREARISSEAPLVSLGGRAIVRSLIERHDARQTCLEILDARAARWMRAQEFRWPAACDLLHLLPQRDGSVRIVARASHQLEAHAVGFGFLLTAVRQRKGHLRNLARNGHRRVARSRCDGANRQCSLLEISARQALA